MLSTESSPRRRLGTSTRELHGASLCLIVASFSMSHFRVDRFQRTAPSIRSNLVFRSDRPSALAVLRLVTKSNLVGACYWQIGRFCTVHDDITVPRMAHLPANQCA